MKQRLTKRIFTICALFFAVIFLLNACTAKTVPEPQPTPSLQKLSVSDLIKAYSNGAYDYSFVPLELKGFSENQFDPWIRPVIPALFTKDGNTLFGTHEMRVMGILCGKYIIAASGPFQTAEVPNPEQLYLGGMIVWNIIETAEGKQLETENVKLIKQILTDFGVGIVVLERSPSKYPMPPENTCPFPTGNSEELEALHKLLMVGQIKGEGTKIILPWRQGAITFINHKTGELNFWGSTWQNDWGSPLFALRDGRPELIGLTGGGWLGHQGYETKSVGLTIQKIFGLVKEELGIELKGLGAPTPPSSLITPDAKTLQIRQELLILLNKSDDLYARTLQYFDLTDQKPDTISITQCVQKVTILTDDDQRKFFSRKDGTGFVFGEYLFVPISLYPALPPPGVPPPLLDPTMPPEEQQKFLELFQKELERVGKFTHQVLILWPNEGPGWNLQLAERVEIKDAALSFELDKMNVRVLKRVPKFYGADNKKAEFPVCSAPVAQLDNIDEQDLVATPEFLFGKKEDEALFGIGEDAYQGHNQNTKEFYFQGSVSGEDLGMPVFALNNQTHQWEVVGLVAQTFAPQETRGRAVRIDKLIEILTLIEAQSNRETEHPDGENK